MPCHHAKHVQNVGPNLFVHNENSAYVMPHAHRQASCPYENVVCQKLLMDTPFMLAKLNLIKLSTSHFSTHYKYENCKPEHAKNDSHCHAQWEQG